jgi:nickel-dependent lactate racemase
MAQTGLGYGRRTLELEYDETRFRLLAPDASSVAAPLADTDIFLAFDIPHDSPPLDDIVSPGESVLIVVPDATRRAGAGQIVNLLVRRLVQAGVTPADIRIIFATGLHRPVTADERRELLTDFIVQRIAIFDHDAENIGALIDLGTTERGTPVILNRMLTEHTHVITISGIGFHYFAGFTGGRKSICPGLAGRETIEATHLLALDFAHGGRRAGVGSGRLDGNLVHEEMERVAAEIAPSFAINTVTDEHDRVTRIYAGDWRTSHRLACAEYVADHTLAISEKRPLVIASCGGSPADTNLIQAHKTLDAAALACTAGGTIILVAECADGFGRADFLKWFDAADSRALENLLRENYEVNGQTAWALLTKTETFRVVLVSELAPDDVRRMRMIPARNLDEAMRLAGDAESGYVMPHGASYLPVVKLDAAS